MKKEPILSRGFVFSFIGVFFQSMVFYMLISISAEYAGTFGASGSLKGLASSIFVIGVLIMRLMFSQILAKLGWKKMILIFQPLHLASLFLYFLISDLPSFLIIRFVHGLCYGLASSTVLTSGTFHLPKSRYGEANGYLMTGITLAIAAGPFSAGFILDHLGANGCFIAAILITVGMWAMLHLAKTDYPDVVSIEREAKLKNKNVPRGLNKLIEVSVIPITICTFSAAFSYSSVLSFIRTYGHETGYEKAVASFFIVYAVVLLFSRPFAGKIQDKKGDAFILIPCIVLQIISHLLLGLVVNPFGIILSSILCAAGYGSAISVLSTITIRDVSMERKSYAVNTYWIGCDLANGLGPVILGAVMQSFGITNMYIWAAVISAFTLVFYKLINIKR